MGEKWDESRRKLEVINSFSDSINIMEVCGTHTWAISKYGFRNIINKNINFISGPGCPVCVTSEVYIDFLYSIALKKDYIITTYGDMIRVPGSHPEKTLENARALGGDIRMVYSSIDAVNIAESNPDKKIIFLGIGFETTCPHTALAVQEAEKRKLENFFVLSLHKKIEPVMRMLLEDKSININGFLCPGHVAAIIGEKGFDFLNEYDCYGVIAGFEFEDIINAVYDLILGIKNKDNKVKNLYKRAVTRDGNKQALELIDKVFYLDDSYWRGIGVIKNSGYKFREKYRKYDLENIFFLKKKACQTNGCQCGEVLKGIIKPYQCRLFERVCNPENPVGPCMVSSEGSCGIYYKYRAFA